MNTDIFRQYDIRGIADSDLTDDVVRGLGRAFASRMQRAKIGNTVGVGYDMRVSSKRLRDALIAGLTESGCDVVDLGMVPTPLVYFSKYTTDVEACIQITGSHNPGEYNGFKMMMGADTLHGEAIQELRQLIETQDFVEATREGVVCENPSLIADYMKWVTNNLELGPKRPKVVLDCGNGIAGVCAPELVESLGFETISLFPEPDGNFPNHHPDPTVPKNLQHLIAAVKEHGADVGVAYDGDGDRIGVVDENGEIIWGDKLMIILSRSVLKEHPGATIIGEVKCSQTLFDDIEANGGVPIMSMVGHSLIKAKIKETNAKLAGEMSGHIFFNDRFFGFDDAIYATGRVLEILSHADVPVSGLLHGVPKTFATPEIRKDCAENIKFHVPGRVAEAFSNEFDVNTIDGARINFGDGWGLVRASNTQPVLVMRVEANSEARRDEILATLEAKVTSAIQALETT